MGRSSASDVEKAREEASRWLGRLGRGLRDDEGARLREWLEQPLNRTTIAESARLWHQPEVIAVLGELVPLSQDFAPGRRKAPKSGALTMSLMAVAAAGVVFAAALALGGKTMWAYLFHRSQVWLPSVGGKSYVTAIGEARTVSLPDNSTVQLNTRTRMFVNYGATSRDVTLGYGEADFHVMRDDRRPFSLLAGKHHLEVEGTRFDVRVLSADTVLLTVTEGTVKVLYSSVESWDTPAVARLHDNYTFDDTTVGATETALLEPGFLFARKIDASDADARLAWRHGMIMLRGARLQDALAEVDRYTDTQFVLADDRMRDIRIGGDFRTGDVSGLLQSLKKDFRIDSRRDLQGRVVLSSLAGLPPAVR
jgi:transmembrane sensor